MKPALSAKEYRVYAGDCIAGMLQLPPGRVQCCVTSPPYFNQRDYGTATWEGGDTECDHVRPFRPWSERPNPSGSGIGKGGNYADEQAKGTSLYKDVCGKCGARRIDQQIGLEPTPEAYVATMVEVGRSVRHVLRDDGVFFLNLGDKYSATSTGTGGASAKQDSNRGSRFESRKLNTGLQPKQLLGIPWRVALALQADGWVLRSDIIWHRVNAMPGSQQDRPTCNHEYIFLLTKQPRYYYDHVAVRTRAVTNPHAPQNSKIGNIENRHVHLRRDYDRQDKVWAEDGMSNLRTVWPISIAAEKEGHFAAYPERLILPCILAGTSAHGRCPKCYAPYKRLVKKQREATRPGTNTKVTGNTMVDGNRDPERHVTAIKTVGWAATCTCNAGDPLPCVVLDPFAGTGTTLAAAIKKNRLAIGFELNPKYIEIIGRKLNRALAKKGFGL